MLKSKSFTLRNNTDKNQKERDLLYEPRRIRWNRYIIALSLIGFSLFLILSNVNFSGDSYEMIVVPSIETENAKAEVGTSTTSDNYDTITTSGGSTVENGQSVDELGEDREEQGEKGSAVIGVLNTETAAAQVPITSFTCNDNNTCKTIICTGQPVNSIAIEKEFEYFIQWCKIYVFDVIIENCVFQNNVIDVYMFSGSYRLNTLTIRNCQLQTIVDSAFNQATMNKLVNLTFEGVQLKSLSEKTFVGLQTVQNFMLINQQQTADATLMANNFLQPMAVSLSTVILQQTQEQCNCQTIYNPTDWLGGGSDTLYKQLLFVDLSGTNFNHTLSNRTFSKLMAVQQLRLANCNLSVIGENVFTEIVQTLKYLDLRGNNLQLLDGEFVALATLNNVTMEMSNNLWRCCENTDLVYYLQQVDDQYAREVVCATPLELQGVQIRYVELNCSGLVTTTNTNSLTKPPSTTIKPTATTVAMPTTATKATQQTITTKVPIETTEAVRTTAEITTEKKKPETTPAEPTTKTTTLTIKTTTLTIITPTTRSTVPTTITITEPMTTTTKDTITTTILTSPLTTTVSPLDKTSTFAATTTMMTTTPWITETPNQKLNTTTINTETTLEVTLNATMVSPTAIVTPATTMSTTTEEVETTVPSTPETTINEATATTRVPMPPTATSTSVPKTTTTTPRPTTVKPNEPCYQNKSTKFLVCSYKIAVSVCDYDVPFNVTTISPKSVELRIGDNTSSFEVIYFPALNYSNYQGLAVGSNSSIDIGYLTSNQSYVFCLLPIGWITTSPFNCRSAYLPLATPKSWLHYNDIALFFTISILITVVCVVVGVAAVYFLLRWRPTLMHGSKRLRRLASTSHEVLLFPKRERTSLDSHTYAMNELSNMPSSISDTLTPENCLNIKSYDYMQYFKNHELNKKQTNVAYISYIRPPDNRAPALPPEASGGRASNSCSGYIPVRQLSQQSTVIMENEPRPLKSCLSSGSRLPSNGKAVEFENEYESLDYYQEIY